MKEVKAFIRVPGEHGTVQEALRAIELSVGYPVQVSWGLRERRLYSVTGGYYVDGDVPKGSQAVVFSLAQERGLYREVGRETYEVETALGVRDEEYPVFEWVSERSVTDWVLFYD